MSIHSGVLLPNSLDDDLHATEKKIKSASQNHYDDCKVDQIIMISLDGP